MPLRYEPTLVIAVDDGSKMKELIGQVRFWLEETQPQVLPIVRFGITDGEGLKDPTGQPIGDDIAKGLNIWLDEIGEVENLGKVRQAGFELSSDLLVRRIVVAVDSQTEWNRIETVLEALAKILQQRREPTIDLLVAVLAQSQDNLPPKNLKELHGWLNSHAQNFSNVNLLVFDRYRNDGAIINPAQLPMVITFLLLIALMPYEADEHWLFSGAFGKPTIRTAGLGIVYVPLPDIANTAAKWLCHQLSHLALREQVNEGFLQERWQEMERALDEERLWREIFKGLSDYGIGADVTEDSFVVNLPEGLVRLDLSAIPWDKWTERIADWEAKWMLMLEEFWLPKVREGANETQQKVAKELEQSLDKCVANGVAIIATVEKLMAKMQENLINWKSRKAPRGIRLTQKEFQDLDTAIRQVPNPLAIAARIFLIGTVIVYFTFIFARWSWLSGFIANWLRNFLPFVEAWMVPAFIGLLGFLAILRLIWKGWRTYDEAVKRVEAIKERCIRAVAEEIASILREAGLQALERFNKYFEGWAKRTMEDNREAAENIGTQRQGWEASFKGFRASDYPLVRSCVQKWGQLESVFMKAMEGKPYSELWQQLLKDAQLTSWEQWLNRWLDRSAAVILEQAAKKIWETQLKGDKVKRLSTYLHEDKARELLESCYDEAGKFLYPQVQSGTSLRWSLKPEGESNLSSLSDEILQRRYGNIRDWQTITLPSVIGYLQVAEAQIP